MIRKIGVSISLWFIFSLPHGFAKPEKHSQWTISLSKKELKVGETVDVVFHVAIDKGWYVYATDFDSLVGPLITHFVFQKNSSYDLIQKTNSIKSTRKYDKVWEGEISYFTGSGEFRQSIKILELPLQISGMIEYQECSDIEGKCVQHEEDFSIISSPQKTTNDIKPFVLQSKKTDDSSVTDSSSHQVELEKIKTPSTGNTFSNLWQFFLLAFGAGLAALLTPCVFPVIPMTVTYFIKESKSRKKAILKALWYGTSIILIYTTIGTVIAKVNGPEFATWLSTHWIPNILFFLVFIVFALSFFGMFEILLPSSWVNRMDHLSERGKMAGVFFMAFTLVLVSFSCTGPIVGSILVESSRGGFIKPIVGMFGFSLALAIVFTGLAIFPEWLSKLPKSGGWLNVVKVVLGFIELALAFKFLSTADQVYHWHLLDRETMIVIWASIFFVAGLYLLGLFRLPHDSEAKFIAVPRLVLGISCFAFVFYLLPGLVGAPLKNLSGYLPPLATQDFSLYAFSRGDSKTNSICDEHPLYSDFLFFPHGLRGYFDYEEGLACAKKLNKPVFLDFTGHSCTNCRQMEEKVWSNPEILKLLRDEYIIIALYTDERKELPPHQWHTSTYDGKLKKTIGKYYTDFQITTFNTNALPFYCLIDTQGQLLVPPKGYDLKIDHFLAFLREGVKKFHNNQE